jgi:hypothetical protein
VTTRGKESFSSQENNLAVDRAVSLLRTSAAVLCVQADRLQQTPSRQARAALKRVLSGCLADIEVVRQSVRD